MRAVQPSQAASWQIAGNRPLCDAPAEQLQETRAWREAPRCLDNEQHRRVRSARLAQSAGREQSRHRQHGQRTAASQASQWQHSRAGMQRRLMEEQRLRAAARSAAEPHRTAMQARWQQGTGARQGAGIDWSAYTGLWQRCFQADISPDDLWGAGTTVQRQQQQQASYASHTNGSSSTLGPQPRGRRRAAAQHGAPASSTSAATDSAFEEEDYEATGFAWSPDWAAYDRTQQQQQWGAQPEAESQASSGPAAPAPRPRPPLPATATEDERLLWEVETELLALLQQCGNDLLDFLLALGVRCSVGADRQATLRSAWRASMLLFHPDMLQQQPRRQQMVGLVATRLINELWRRRCA